MSETAGTGRGRSLRRVAGLLAAAVGLSVGVNLASAGSAAAAPCPTNSILLGNLCLVIGHPPTTTPSTTPPTTAPPVVQLPPVTVPPVTVPPVLNPGTSTQVVSAARRLLDLSNAERERAGLPRLAWRDDVAEIAVAHSREMAAAGDIFHSTTFFSAAVKNLLGAVVRGENVAYNADIENTHARLMASAGHRANILDPRFSVAGIGVVQAPDGRYFVTENFIQPSGAPVARATAAPRAAAPAASRKAAVAQAPAAKAAAPTPATTVPAPPAAVAPAPAPAPVAAPVLAVEPVSSAVSATAPATGRPMGLPLGAAVVLLCAAIAACCITPRRTWA